jgi:hypothetical protein
VSLDDPPAHGEADSAALHAPLEAGEHAEDRPRVLAGDTDPVVLHGHDPFVLALRRGDLDPRRLASPELQRIPHEVLEDAAQLPGIALYVRQLGDEAPLPAASIDAQVGGDVGHHVIEADLSGSARRWA